MQAELCARPGHSQLPSCQQNAAARRTPDVPPTHHMAMSATGGCCGLGQRAEIIKMKVIMYQEIRVQEKVADINLPKKIRPLCDEA